MINKLITATITISLFFIITKNRQVPQVKLILKLNSPLNAQILGTESTLRPTRVTKLKSNNQKTPKPLRLNFNRHAQSILQEDMSPTWLEHVRKTCVGYIVYVLTTR